jgi:hypothetical protein
VVHCSKLPEGDESRLVSSNSSMVGRNSVEEESPLRDASAKLKSSLRDGKCE